jgi:hypothetical protein
LIVFFKSRSFRKNNPFVSLAVWVLSDLPRRLDGMVWSYDEKGLGITRVYGDFEYKGISKIFDTDDFGFRKITVDRSPAPGKTVNPGASRRSP